MAAATQLIAPSPYDPSTFQPIEDGNFELRKFDEALPNDAGDVAPPPEASESAPASDVAPAAPTEPVAPVDPLTPVDPTAPAADTAPPATPEAPAEQAEEPRKPKKNFLTSFLNGFSPGLGDSVQEALSGEDKLGGIVQSLAKLIVNTPLGDLIGLESGNSSGINVEREISKINRRSQRASENIDRELEKIRNKYK
jgi:hypothetical protein